MQVDPDRLKGFLTQVARERSPFAHPIGYRQVVSYLEETLRGFGYTVRKDSFPFEGESFSNLIAQQGHPVSPLLVGAHLDAVDGSPGADDNASGVAVLLEVARLFSNQPVLEKVQFVAFTLEEWGMVGSRHCAASLRRAGVRLAGMISLEMIGFTHPRQAYPPGLAPFYPKRGDFIGVGANWRSRRLLQSFLKGMRKVKDLPVETLTLPANGGLVPAVRLSDHAPFWDLGYPALLVTDTSFYRNPHYHTPSDTIDTLNLDFLTRVAQGVLEGILGVLERAT